ncbi:hypothetical protein FDP41_001521 [Naegleria fowleri]|uniref:Uncharacterized protein n=1 Tax=Naegleria fowleri TaxID=5763 RepID=A0A6A5BZT4_NAEFO|nr:uncharacterized protein FDP41_001521 [Naegleria fowleri]KAF0979178.1 hypothetical protein FDP41_001521 [Naegleria fowleri]CAG4707824.1 unnamed protein product [Naegleria fowleri]
MSQKLKEIEKQFNGSKKKKIIPIEDIRDEEEEEDEWEDIDEEEDEDEEFNVHPVHAYSRTKTSKETTLPSAEASNKVQQALKDNEAFKTLFQSRVQVNENFCHEGQGRDIYSSQYVVQMKFGGATESTASLEIYFEGDVTYDPMEEGSTGKYVRTVTVYKSNTKVLSGELFRNLEEVDYCSGYGGVKLTSNVKKLKDVLNIDSKMFLSLMDMICKAIPVFHQGEMKFVSKIMKRVNEYAAECIQAQPSQNKQ